MYSFLIISVLLFGFNFFFSQQYQKEEGEGRAQIISFTLFQNLAGLIVLLVINKFRFEFTWFSFLIAFLSALNAICFSLFSLKAFKHVNLSIYSICSMLGGMILPSIVGVAFFNEPFTVAKIICSALVILALVIGFKPDKNSETSTQKKNKLFGMLFCLGIFITNGLSGVFSTVFALGNYEKTSAEGYSILICACVVAITAVAYFIDFKNRNKYSLKTWAYTVGSGVLNRIGNNLLVLSLALIPASVQYPLVTIGVMISSTVIAFFTKQKVAKTDIVSLIIAVVGVVAMIFIKI